MSDNETEKRVEAPIAKSSDGAAAKSEGVFTSPEKQIIHTEATAANKASQKDSHTMEGLSDEKIAEIQAAGGFQKFGITGLTDGFADGTLIAQAADSKVHPRESNQQQQCVTGTELINIAERLGKDPHRWKQTKDSPNPKCNVYAEAVLLAGHIPVPWKVGYSNCKVILDALNEEVKKPNSMWEKVYSYDQKHGPESDKKFTEYIPQKGDVMIWHYTSTHMGICAPDYDILYAGSESKEAPNGWRHGKIDWFTLDPQYGAPEAVFRYKGLKN